MNALRVGLGLIRTAWNAIPTLAAPEWFGYGIGVDQGWQAAYIVLFCKTTVLPSALQTLLSHIEGNRYQVMALGRSIDVQVVATGAFVGLGGHGVGTAPARIEAGGPVIASWTEDGRLEKGPIGTIGAILRKAGDPQPWLLSANHVIGMNGEQADLKVHLPMGALPGESIGSTLHVVPIGSGPCQADAALVRIEVVKSRVRTDHPSGLRDRRPFEVSAGVPGGEHSIFKKVGATTGSTTSQFVAIEATVFVDLDFRGNAEMVNQIVARPFADSGDSGSLAVETVSGRPVGLLIAQANVADEGGAAMTVISPMSQVLDSLPSGFELVLPGEPL